MRTVMNDDPFGKVGSFFVPKSSEAYQLAHDSADTDADRSAIHHTLGTGPFQAAPGNHRHSKYADTGWADLPLINGWLNYDARKGQFRRYMGRVYFKGIIKSGPLATNIFTPLGDGFRPISTGVPSEHHFACPANDAFACVVAWISGTLTQNTGSNI